MLSKSARTAKNDVETEDSVRTFVALHSTTKTKSLQALVTSSSVSTLKSSERQYCASRKTELTISGKAE